MSKRLAAVLVATLGVCLLWAVAASATSHKVFVRRSIVSDQFVYRPHSIGLSGDGTFQVNRIRWLSYGGRVAVAKGTAYTRGCIPSCANGPVFTPRAKLRLTRRVLCDGRYIYARLHFVLIGHVPTGFRHHGFYSLRPTNEVGEPTC